MKAHATLVLIKPDAIKRGLTGAVLTRLEEAKLALIGVKVTAVSQELAETHYQALRDKPFFREVVDYLCGALHDVPAILALVYYGPGAIAKIRAIAGATNPEFAEPTSLRGAYGRVTAKGVMENVIHASSNTTDAAREIALWFRPEELLVPVSTRAPARRSAATGGRRR